MVASCSIACRSAAAREADREGSVARHERVRQPPQLASEGAGVGPAELVWQPASRSPAGAIKYPALIRTQLQIAIAASARRQAPCPSETAASQATGRRPIALSTGVERPDGNSSSPHLKRLA